MLLNEIQEFKNLFDFAVRGIGEHLERDQIEPEAIMGALYSLQKQLAIITTEAETLLNNPERRS